MHLIMKEHNSAARDATCFAKIIFYQIILSSLDEFNCSLRDPHLLSFLDDSQAGMFNLNRSLLIINQFSFYLLLQKLKICLRRAKKEKSS